MQYEWTIWHRLFTGGFCIAAALVGLTGLTIALVNRDDGTSWRSHIGEAFLAFVAVILWLRLLWYYFLNFALHDWEPPDPSESGGSMTNTVEAALFVGFGCVLAGMAVLLARSAFGSPPKWLREMKQMRDSLRGRGAKASPEVGSGSADPSPEKDDDGHIPDETIVALAGVGDKVSKVNLNPLETVGNFLVDKVSDVLLFSRVGRLLGAALYAALASVMFKTVPYVARGERPRPFERLVEYGRGFLPAIAILAIAVAVVLGLAFLPILMALGKPEDGRTVIRKRSTRWLVAFTGYGVAASLVVGVSIVGWMGWLVEQVRDAWQQLTALPF